MPFVNEVIPIIVGTQEFLKINSVLQKIRDTEQYIYLNNSVQNIGHLSANWTFICFKRYVLA